jgi:hypothetical protein
MRGALGMFSRGVTRRDIDRNMHAGGAGVHELRAYLDHLSDLDRPLELDAADVHGHAVTSGPTGSTGITGLVNPFHHCATMHLAAEIHIGRLGQKAEGQITLDARHCFVPSILDSC